MDDKARKYLIVETLGSGIINGILNCVSAYAIFHAHSITPVSGKGGLFQDSIGETFIVTFLSALGASLIARRRRKAGTLPSGAIFPPRQAGNLYLRALLIGLAFTVVLVPCSALLLPRVFPNGVTLHNVLLFKTIYGAIIGATASMLAVRKALNEVD